MAASPGQEGSPDDLAGTASAAVIDPGRLLFQIPVYRLSIDDWMDGERKLEDPYVEGESDLRGEVKARLLAQQITRRQPWDYNEVIGWIEIAGFHDVIKAYFSMRQGKRMNRHSSQPFGISHKLTELWLSNDQTDELITSELRKDLARAVKSVSRLKRSNIDFRAYDRIAPWLNWRQALLACERRTTTLD
jgi:hypothetical protein